MNACFLSMTLTKTEAKNQKLFASERQRMVRRQIKARGIRDKALLKAMKEVPRELFVPENLREFSYDDAPLPIGEAQTISQPYIVALMIEAAGLTPGSRVLEIGAGSGYCVGVLSHLAARVFAIERNATLASALQRRLDRLGCSNIHTREGDGSTGWAEHAPFDAIIVSAVAPRVGKVLLEQLALGGRLIIPVGQNEHDQRLLRVTRSGDDDFVEEDLGGVHFVPLIGEAAFSPGA